MLLGIIRKWCPSATCRQYLPVYYCFFKENIGGDFHITALFAALMIGQNHLQLVYYTLIISAIMSIAFIIKSYKEKQTATALKGVALGLLAGILGLACSAVTMMPTYEYAKESMRGGRSELTNRDKQKIKPKAALIKIMLSVTALAFLKHSLLLFRDYMAEVMEAMNTRLHQNSLKNFQLWVCRRQCTSIR